MAANVLLMAVLVLAQSAPRTTPRPPARPAARPSAQPVFFTSPYSLDEMRGKQAVVETTLGSFVVQLLPDAAPNHVAFFMKQAREGALNRTLFHRVVKYAVIQGGDPLTKDPAKSADYGQGGFNQLKSEPNAEKHTAGAISTVVADGQPDSGGSQFFISVTDQPSLDGRYDVFGRIVDGIEVVQRISAVDADATGAPKTRVEITNVTIRDTPPDPFVNDTVAQLATYRVVVETTMGKVELEMLPDLAPETVRAFLRMADAGVYDGVGVHRVASNFVIQTGAMNFRSSPLTARQQRLVHNLPPEFTDTPNVPGVVAMAHGDNPASGQTSFFVCVGHCRALDNKFTVFARVVNGMDILNAMAAVPVDGETPRTPITMTSAKVVKRD
jgi:peptidyl-prolyl cis-trans isomerase B (cyclophilin B)